MSLSSENYGNNVLLGLVASMVWWLMVTFFTTSFVLQDITFWFWLLDKVDTNIFQPLVHLANFGLTLYVNGLPNAVTVTSLGLDD